jgi:hypothetical protein
MKEKAIGSDALATAPPRGVRLRWPVDRRNVHGRALFAEPTEANIAPVVVFARKARKDTDAP